MSNLLHRAAQAMQEGTESRTLRLDELHGNGIQARVAMDQQTVDEYAQAMQEGATFPPVEVVYDGERYWLWDGFHRVAAARQVGQETILVNVRRGAYRDALLLAVGANATHGLRRTNADKRRAVLMLLEDPEWSQWSDREIARRARVSQPLVSKLRRELAESAQPSKSGQMERRVRRGDQEYTMRPASRPRELVTPGHIRRWAAEHAEISGRPILDVIERALVTGPLVIQLRQWLKGQGVVPVNLEGILRQAAKETREAAQGRSRFVAPEPEPETEPAPSSWPSTPDPRSPQEVIQSLRRMMPHETEYGLRRHALGLTVASLALDEFQAEMLLAALQQADTTPETEEAIQDVIAQLQRALRKLEDRRE